MYYQRGRTSKKQGAQQHAGYAYSGEKEFLDIYLAAIEGAKCWLKIVSDLKASGVKDILIDCTDNLKGFLETILSIFPQSRSAKSHCAPNRKPNQIDSLEKPKEVYSRSPIAIQSPQQIHR